MVPAPYPPDVGLAEMLRSNEMDVVSAARSNVAAVDGYCRGMPAKRSRFHILFVCVWSLCIRAKAEYRGFFLNRMCYLNVCLRSVAGSTLHYVPINTSIDGVPWCALCILCVCVCACVFTAPPCERGQGLEALCCTRGSWIRISPFLLWTAAGAILGMAKSAVCA